MYISSFNFTESGIECLPGFDECSTNEVCSQLDKNSEFYCHCRQGYSRNTMGNCHQDSGISGAYSSHICISMIPPMCVTPLLHNIIFIKFMLQEIPWRVNCNINWLIEIDRHKYKKYIIPLYVHL